MAGSTTQYSDTPARSYSRRLIVSSRLRVPLERDLDDQFGDSPDVERCDHLRRPLVRQVQQVGLDDVKVGEDDIQRSNEDTTDRVLLQPVADQKVEIAQRSADA